MRKGFSLGVVAACMLALGACGSDNPTSTSSSTTPQDNASVAATIEALTGTVSGAGASSQESAMAAWRAGFQNANPNATVNYDSVGSGAGVTQLAAKAVSWAGSDAVLHGDQIEKVKAACGGQDALHLPVYVSPIAIIFNLDGIDSLNLDAETIAKIFRGDITKWNDPVIAKQNEGVNLPDMTITPVHRADKSGTTFNFTEYLHAAAPSVWTDKATEVWPISGGESGDKTSGLVQVIQSGQGTIGYADASKAGSLGQVALKVGDNYLKFSPEAAAKGAEVSQPAEGASDNNLMVKIDRTPSDPGAYPLILISYSIVCPSYEDANTSKMLKSFMHYMVSAEGQNAAAQAAGSAPITDALRAKLDKAIDSIK